MKHGKKPTVRQSIFMQQNGFNPYDWFVVKDTSTEMWMVARNEKCRVVTLFKTGKEAAL